MLNGLKVYYNRDSFAGWGSLYCMESTIVSVLEVEVSGACELTTEVIWVV